MAAPNITPPSPPDEQLVGRLLVGRYRLTRHIASGGMAEVWEATDQTLARAVAVKLLHRHLGRDDSFVRRFRAEAVAAARLAHPSIVSVYDTFSADGLEGIVMELVSGTTMREDLDTHGPMRLDAALAVGSQIADALGAAHASGLVHRDVKPANILLSADGRVLVADFGIAKAAEGNDLTNAGAMVGTAKYLAPEQVEGGAIDGRADLYALGVVLYEALTGVAPFVAETDTATALARLHRYPTAPRDLRPEIPPLVEAVIMQAMARAPADRFASAAAMRTALLSAGAQPSRAPAVAATAAATQAPPLPPPPPPPPLLEHPTDEAPAAPRSRSRRWMVVVVLVALALVAGYVASTSEGSDPAAGRPVGIAKISSFDPQGDDAEHEGQVGLAIDGDSTTAWTSERYRDPVGLANKDGFGLVVTLDEATDIGHVDVHSPEGGWSARLYTSRGTGGHPDLSGWGAPVTSVQGASAGRTRLAVPAGSSSATGQLLLWFTRAPTSGVVQVAEIEVAAR